MSQIQQNLLILFLLLPCMFGSWWGTVYLLNWGMGFSIRKVYELIYTDPLASAVLRVGVMASLAYMVSSAFERLV